MDQPTEIKERTQINKRLRPGEATSPAPSCTSLQSDQSMDRPKEFKDVTHGIQMNERLRPDDTISPTPSCTSLKSDQSMDRPIRFKDRTKSLRLRPDDTVSPAPSCTSLKSDQSMDRPIEFKDRTQHFIKNERLRPDDTISPTPSCTSLKSDQSMDRPIRFKDRTKSLRLRPDDTVSPAPSCTSLKSDQSMDRPIEFKDRTQHFIKNERLRPDDTISPTPSCTSLKSDQSMDRPIEFKDRTKSLSTLSATLLTEDHYRCSVCTEVFKDPVSIPCGHSYCKHCIEIYWSKPTQAGCYACPQCRKRFRNRPVLYVNVALAKVIEELKQAGFSPALPAHCYAGPDDVPCDICTGMKLRAVKSCLTCTASFCETHIRQHYTVPALQRHNLVEPGNFSHDNETFRISRAEEELQEEIKGLTATVAALKMTLREKDTRAKRLCKGFEVHCHDFPYDAIEVVTLGRPLSLGMLYDTNSDSYCKDTFLWNEGIISSMRVSLPRPQTEVKVLEGDSLQERFRILEMSPVLRTKALHGLIEMIGAAAFLNHPVQSEHQDRVTLHYKTTTRLDMISQRLLQEGIPPSVINSTSATHVIIAVCYGAQAFFVFDHVQIGSEKTSKMKNVIKKVTSSFCASQINLNLSDNEKSLSLFYNCSLFIDVGDLKSPVSFDKAVEIYGSLPMLLGSKGENAVPMKVWLYPLKNLDKTSVCALLRGVSKSLMQRAENVLGHLKNQIRKCQDFMSSPGNLSVIIWFPALKDKLANFSELLHKYQAHFQKGITEIAEAIHVKEEEGENRLQHLLDRHDQSPFSAENTNQWLENKETELKILNDCRAADIPVVKSQAELQQVLSHSQKTRVMCLTLTSPEKEDLFLSTLKQEFESDHIIQRDSLVFKPVLISQKVLFDMQLFIAVKEANEDTEQTKFIAVIVPDVCDEYTVQFYHAGMIVSRNVKLGLKPNVPQIVQIKQTSVSLMLNHLLNKRTERYVVEYRVVADGGNNNSWKQTTVFAEKCVLSGLKTESEYQLRYAVGDNQCMSNFSRIIRFKTSSAAIPGKPSVNKLNRETLKITWLKAEANCPVLHYMVEYKEAGLKGWSSVLTQGPQCECTLTVPHSTCYTVRVSAVYKDITSKPSEETSVPVEVWIINLAEIKSSNLLEVFKLQRLRKPVELIGWSDEESEMRGFLQCLPYISQLRFTSPEKETFEEWENRKRLFVLNHCLQAALHQKEAIGKTMETLLSSVYYEKSDFLLDMYSIANEYETQTGRSVLPALQPIYQSAPAVWYIDISEGKSSILLEVLKLQTAKKPVELKRLSLVEGDFRGFLQCLPYISELRFYKDVLEEGQKKRSALLCLLNLSIAASECVSTKGANLISSVCSYTNFPCGKVSEYHPPDNAFQTKQCNFLLDLYSHVKDYESQTGRSVLPALQPIYQSVPAVWIINLSGRKSSILLEVLKLQTEKKPVELKDWSDEESEVRGFLQFLPYISELRFTEPQQKSSELWEKRKRLLFLNLCLQAALYQKETIEATAKILLSFVYYEKCDFLLDLYSHVKDYESQTGRSVLPVLQPIYQSVPEVWIINLSERKSSILLEVLKLQTEKKPVKLRDWSDEESEVRGFLQCLPYISQLRFDFAVQFLVNLIVAASEIDTTGENYTELLTSVCSYTSFPCDKNYSYKTKQCDFLLDLYSHVKDYEIQTGRSVLPALQPIYQSAPEVWIINLSERKSSILLEVLKLQTEKKPVELMGWSDEESEVRGFLQCLPYISQLRFGVKIVYKRKESVVQFLVNLTVAASEFDTTTGENYTELLTSVCSYTSFPCDEDDDDDYSEFEIEQGDFLLDLYSHVKDYESQTGRSVLPALQPIYQSVPAVWIINLSERKSSILLEVLKLQTEKKPVELMGWSDEENEVRGFLQCLPYISQLRFSPIVFDEEESEDTLQFLVNLIVAASKCETDTGENYTELLTSVCSYTSFPYDDDNYYKTKQCDFLLDLCSHVKDYESQTGRSVLPALQPIYQSVPAVWIINLSERKSSILLEVLKLQTEKKPVELRDWSDEESEVRGFLQCLPYISQLRFGVKIVYKRKESAVQFLVNLIVAASEIDTTTGENYTELLTSVCSYTSFPFDDDDNYYKTRQCDFLLDLYSHVKDYESQTGRSVLPALQPIYQSAPAVWIINLSERKSSILLEVLKLQTEKKPVELIDWSDEESEVRGFLQCLPYISQLRNAEQYFPSLCKVFGSRVKADQVTPLLQALNFTVTLSGILHSSTCRSVGRVLGLSSSKLNLTLNPQAISLKGVRLLFKHITHLHKLSLRKNILLKIVRALRSVDDCRSLAIEELSLVMRNTKTLKQNHSRILSKLSVFLSLWTVRCLDLTKCKIEALPLTPLLQVQGPLTIRFSKETLQQLVEMVFEAHDDELTRLFLEKVSEDLSSCSLSWEVIHYLLQCKSLNFKLDFRKIKVSSENIRELLPLLEGIQFKRLSPSFTLSIMMEIYETRSPQYVSRLLSSSESYISLNNRVLDSVHCAALRFTLEHCNTVKLNLFWTSIPEGELESILPLLKGVSELSVDRQLLLKLLHCCSSSDHQQEAAAVLLSALQNILDFSCCSALDLTDTQHNQDDFNLTTRDCKIILSVLQQTQSIVKVVLKDCEVSDKAMNELLPILPKVQLRCSKALLLHFLACISKGTKRSSLRWFKALSRALGGEMDLSHTPIDLKACEKLALFLEYSEGLSELDLSHCKLTDECMKPLIPHLHKTQTLDLSHNKVTDESARRIHSIVSTHSNIQTVRLFGNKIKDGKLFIRDNRFEIW
ncbi:uncharacterized protein si:ch211-281l24.3 isoform X32 [Myxocyprinus asiaticus]|uniref:uncharacterized protein si:ch211-281l24.3 isoform X32 n=1 Tax=Myxocyprinus asiaticus TaxID=70543 RepID=UPI002221B676|nr:uncharacterized protein si:ch211-281l24.3 isoform X32 [Myxocyprinus asiaticus]